MNDPGNAPLQPATASSDRSWFDARPIPVYIIGGLCLLQFLGIAVFIMENWTSLVELVRTGAVTILGLLGKLLYPGVLILGGVLLLCMRRQAIYLFGLYFLWGCVRIVEQHLYFVGYLSLALVLGVIVYCLRLRKRGLLK